jgi:aspartate aminotransferase
MSGVVDFAAGAPDIPTPEVAGEAAMKAVASGHTRYTGAAGIPELREAVVADFARRKGVTVEADDVLVAGGAKLALFCVLSALADTAARPGTVVHPTPHYGGYPNLIRRAGLGSRRVETSPADGYKLTPTLLADALDEGTVAVMLNAPGNPTGVMYDSDELGEIVEVVGARSSAVIVSDEIYSRFAYDAPFVSPASLADDTDRVVIVDGVSKSFGMTGWRVGYAAGPRALMRAARAVNTQVANCASSVSQWAAAAALTSAPDDHLDLARHRRLRDIAFAAASALPEAAVVRPAGGIYQAVQLSDGMLTRLAEQPGSPSEQLLALGGVRIPNDTTFGRPGLLRLTFSLPEHELVEGFRRLSEAFARLRPAH